MNIPADTITKLELLTSIIARLSAGKGMVYTIVAGTATGSN